MSTTVTGKPTTIQRFFDELALRTSEPLLHRVTGTIEWNILGVGRWWVRISSGVIHVSESPEDTDCIISCEPDVFAKAIGGGGNLVSLALRGDIRVSGSAALALSFQRLLP